MTAKSAGTIAIKREGIANGAVPEKHAVASFGALTLRSAREFLPTMYYGFYTLASPPVGRSAIQRRRMPIAAHSTTYAMQEKETVTMIPIVLVLLSAATISGLITAFPAIGMSAARSVTQQRTMLHAAPPRINAV